MADEKKTKVVRIKTILTIEDETGFERTQVLFDAAPQGGFQEGEFTYSMTRPISALDTKEEATTRRITMDLMVRPPSKTRLMDELKKIAKPLPPLPLEAELLPWLNLLISEMAKLIRARNPTQPELWVQEKCAQVRARVVPREEMTSAELQEIYERLPVTDEATEKFLQEIGA